MPHRPRKAHVLPVLLGGLVAISFASIFIKLCTAPPLVIAVYRLTIASSFFLLFARARSGPVWAGISLSQRKIAILSGLFLTLHFATWITSLKYTSVASSVILVQSAPVFVALGSTLFLKERPSAIMIVGILITLAGGIMIAVSDFSQDRSSITGNVLAILGAVGAAGYMIAGRDLRRSVDTIRYVAIVYSVSAVFLIFLNSAAGDDFFGYDTNTYLLLIAIAVFPQILGHTIFNWGLRFYSATSISVLLLGEPIGASILALMILKEPLTVIKIFGGAIILFGVCVVLLAEGKQRNNTLGQHPS